MKTIYLIDEDKCLTGGHNANYRNALATIERTRIYDSPCTFPSMNRNPCKGYMVRKRYFEKIPKDGYACLLHLDTIYTTPSIIKYIRKYHNKVVGVLHWYPNSKLKATMLRISAKYIDIIVVHSEYIKIQLSKIGINNVEVIDYPLFCNVDLRKIVPKENTERKNFLCLGGSRLDKGHDIMAESFKYIPDSAKKKISITVAGKEIDVPYTYIREKAEEANIDISFINRRLSEEEYWQLISDCDVILLPYKRVFTGNSGPMTDGVCLNKYILGPDEGNLSFLINTYQLGCTFKIEDPESLGKQIGFVSQLNTKCNHEYRKKLSLDNFIVSYSRLFEKL